MYTYLHSVTRSTVICSMAFRVEMHWLRAASFPGSTSDKLKSNLDVMSAIARILVTCLLRNCSIMVSRSLTMVRLGSSNPTAMVCDGPGVLTSYVVVGFAFAFPVSFPPSRGRLTLWENWFSWLICDFY